MYDFSYEFAFYFTKRKPTVNRVLLSLSLLPPPSSTVFFSHLDFFLSLERGFYRLPHNTRAFA